MTENDEKSRPKIQEDVHLSVEDCEQIHELLKTLHVPSHECQFLDEDVFRVLDLGIKFRPVLGCGLKTNSFMKLFSFVYLAASLYGSTSATLREDTEALFKKIVGRAHNKSLLDYLQGKSGSVED